MCTLCDRVNLASDEKEIYLFCLLCCAGVVVHLPDMIVSNHMSGKQGNGLVEKNICAQGTYSKYLEAKYLVAFLYIMTFNAQTLIPKRSSL